MYLQDEWKLTPALTLNYGARLDEFAANFDNEGQFSPARQSCLEGDDKNDVPHRLLAVFRPAAGAICAAGNDREIRQHHQRPGQHAGRSAEGREVQLLRHRHFAADHQALAVNLDGFYKQAQKPGRSWPIRRRGDLSRRSTTSMAGFMEPRSAAPTSRADSPLSGISPGPSRAAKTSISQQFTIDSDELSYIQSNLIPLDHESEYTASAGVSYEWKDNEVYLDYSVWLGPAVRVRQLIWPNRSITPSISDMIHTFHPNGSHGDVIKLRFDVINLFDEVYQIRSGTGIGVGAPQYGQRRTFYMGLAYQF